MSSRGITYPVLLDQEHEVTQAYGLRGVPTTFFIDGQGVVKARQIGAFMDENSMESAVKRVFPSIVFSPKTNNASDIGGAAPDIGKAAPDFTLQSIDDQSVSLADFRGKTVLLNFWASPCQACLTEFPYFQTALANRNDQQEVILTVNCGDTSQTVHSIVDPIKPSFTVLLDPEGNVCTEYKRGVPTAFLIDGDGIIRAIKDNIFESSGEVETMLDILK
jgi:peroxiredoxin